MEEIALYDRLLEGISGGMAQALSRRKGQEMTINPGREISTLKDTETYEKRTKDWHSLTSFARTGNPLECLADYSLLDRDTLRTLGRISDGTPDRQVSAISRRNGDIIGRFRFLRSLRDCADAGKEPKGITLSFVDGMGMVTPAERLTFSDRGKMTFVKVSYWIPFTAIDADDFPTSFCISRDWKSQVRKAKWQTEPFNVLMFCSPDGGYVQQQHHWENSHTFDGQGKTEKNLMAARNYIRQMGRDGDFRDYMPASSAATETRTFIGDTEVCGFLPSDAQMRLIIKHINIINTALEIIGSPRIGIDSGIWWTSSQTTHISEASRIYADTHAFAKTPDGVIPIRKGTAGNVLPLFNYPKEI